MDGIVREAGECVHRCVNFYFGFVSVAPADDAVGNVLEFAGGETRAVRMVRGLGCGSASQPLACRFFLGSFHFSVLRHAANARSGAPLPSPAATAPRQDCLGYLATSQTPRPL